jgi:hypothetical protein
MRPDVTAPRARWRAAAVAALLLLAAGGAAAEDWRDLSPTQQRALAPLQGVWPRVDDTERRMWLEVADRYRDLPAAEQQRLQQRMAEWSRLSPAQRGQARLQFQEAGRWSPAERRERWEAYQSLDPEARRVLAERWKLEAAAREREQRAQPPGADKRNVFEQPRPSPRPPQATAPTAAAARAGASTRPLARPRDAAPLPAQHGMPKIAATPSFVDPATLLPRRGAQAAAVAPAPQDAPPREPSRTRAAPPKAER